MTHGQLVDAASFITFQFARLWRPFSIEDDDLHIDYTFTLVIDISTDPTPVRGGTIVGLEWGEDLSDPVHTRAQGAALREGVSAGCEDITIVHPHFQGLGTDACAPLLDGGGRISQPRPSTRHRGLQEHASNMMWVGRNQLDPGNAGAAETAAHEIGHFLGLASRPPDGGIMGARTATGVNTFAPRTMTDRDRELVHHAIETRVPGAVIPPTVQVAIPEPPLRRRQRRVSRRR